MKVNEGDVSSPLLGENDVSLMESLGLQLCPVLLRHTSRTQLFQLLLLDVLEVLRLLLALGP